MDNGRGKRGFDNTSGGGYDRNSEQDARDKAYQEYLRLRENRSGGSRGNYVKDDTLYGAYFPSGNKGTGSREQNRSADERYGRRNEGGYRNEDRYRNDDRYRSEGGGYRNDERYRSDERNRRDGYNGRQVGQVSDTPYGNSEMRRRQQQRAEEERRRYMEERRKGQQQVAMQGRKNKADSDRLTRAEKKARKRYGSGKKRGKNGKGLKVALLVVLILVIGLGAVIGLGFTVVKSTLDNVGRIELDPDMIGINPQVDSELRNYRSIALLGIDARDMSSDENVRSDAIIIASINKETNEIKMFSVYRDTMLDLGDDVGLDKVTHAYYYGGPTKVLYALNKNLDLNIKEVVVVNWKSVADTVDALGGLDIEIQESEINEMNKYIQDTYDNIGGSDKKIDSAGMQTLNGNQAVTYARIRKDAVTGDYRRNERMKIVVKAAFDKARSTDLGSLRRISKDILPEIKTNMSSAGMMGMVLKLTSYSMTDSVGWPYEVREWSGGAFYGPPVTLKSNVTELHEQFFGQDGYEPTEDVQEISEAISAKTGYY